MRTLRIMLAHLPDVQVAIYEPSGVCVLLCGVDVLNAYAREGQHYEQFLPPERREKFLWMFERGRLGLQSNVDYPIESRSFEATCKPIYDERMSLIFVLFQVRDVSAERAAMAALAEKGSRDTLTGLPRRSVLHAHLTGMIAQGRPFAVLMVDLDGFKHVNDALGHKAGDQLLCDVAVTLQHCIRTGDLAVRVGGDEFVVVLANAPSPASVATRILNRLLDVTSLMGAGASMGMAVFPDHGVALSELLAAADDAMYTAKTLKDGNVACPPLTEG